jgi:hypothetical protein
LEGDIFGEGGDLWISFLKVYYINAIEITEMGMSV